MKFRDICYMLLATFFAVLAYLFFDSGVNTKTKRYVDSLETGDVLYKVHLLNNDEFNQNYLNMGEVYIASLVDNIEFKFNYKDEFSKVMNGYYTYEVFGELVIYQGNENDILLRNKYNFITPKTTVIDSNNASVIDISDIVNVDYDKYKNEVEKFNTKYGVNGTGYLKLTFRVLKNLEFKNLNNIFTNEATMVADIPLSSNTFRIGIINDNNKSSHYDDFSNKERLNYFFIMMGAVMSSLAITLFLLVVRRIYIVFNKHDNYKRELNKILKDYDDIIVSVKRFYNKKKYNLIYVDSFKDILDVYEKTGSPINFKEVKKDAEAMFLIIDEENAWIYRMVQKDQNK